jgi:acylphosphatase
MKAVSIIVTGDVQGVGFRHYTYKLASELGLKGYVRNMPGNKVEIVAEGTENAITELVEFCKKGPSSGYVNDIKINYSKPSNNYVDFRIEY